MRVYVSSGNVVKAVETQTLLVERAQAPEEKRDRTLSLARVYEDAAQDKKSSFAILEKARKAWPHDAEVLRATAEYHQRHGETAAANVLLDRANAEARRALAHGRFEPAFFGVLRVTAEIRGEADAALTAAATTAALEGKEEPLVQGAGVRALDPALDDLLAPELLTPAFRALLRKLGGALDSAFPVDLASHRGTPAGATPAADELREMAASAGLRSLEVLVSASLGSGLLAASTTPARLLVGPSLLDHPDVLARQFALLRGVALLRTNAAALARIPTIELWPVTAALLKLLAPSFQPQGVDAAKLADAERKVRAALPGQRDHELPTLALEVAGTIGNRASQIGQTVLQWASRIALLAIGSPSGCIRGVALALGQADRLPSDPAERLRWVLRQPEARDLAVFSVSDAYAQARKRVSSS